MKEVIGVQEDLLCPPLAQFQSVSQIFSLRQNKVFKLLGTAVAIAKTNHRCPVMKHKVEILYKIEENFQISHTGNTIFKFNLLVPWYNTAR